MAEQGPETVVHSGSCHCGAVRWEVDAPRRLVVWRCNCSICWMKANDHVIVPHKRFRLLGGEGHLTAYTFNTHRAKHMFCKVCGVQSFYQPRSNPDGFGVNPRCIAPGTVEGIEYRDFDGRNWEQFIDASGIQALSKEGPPPPST